MINNEHKFKLKNREIKKYLKYLDEYFNNSKSLSIVFINKDEMKSYNNEFRNKDYETDVLTFCEEYDNYLGDVLINYDKIQVQADEYNHTFERELFFLITHGYLHLHGYDHMTKEEEKEMFLLQEKLLSEYNIRR